jgi:uncharacterized protein YigE (DUF2233 family)
MEIAKNYANHIGYSDVNPFEIVRRVSDKTIDIRAMEAVRDESWKPDFVPGGFCGMVVNQNKQRWVISSKPDSRIVRIRNGKRGWRDAGGNRYKLSDKPIKFYDYNF